MNKSTFCGIDEVYIKIHVFNSCAYLNTGINYNRDLLAFFEARIYFMPAVRIVCIWYLRFVILCYIDPLKVGISSKGNCTFLFLKYIGIAFLLDIWPFVKAADWVFSCTFQYISHQH